MGSVLRSETGHAGRTTPGRTPSPTDRSALFGLGIYRAVTATWAVVVALVDLRSGVLVEPSLAFGILGPLLAWSALTVVFSRRYPQQLLTRWAQVVDITLGAMVVAAEWVTYDGGHPLRFGAMWQLAPVIGAGLRFGALGGLATGTGLGLVNALALGVTEGFGGRILATVSAVILMGVAGAAAGAILDRLRHVEDDLAATRARERIAQTLHDGVLQTLAAIQRRSDDPDLVSLAARQDRELRRWIRGEEGGDPTPGRLEAAPHPGDLVGSLHDLADRLRSRDGTTLDVVAVTTPTVSTGTAVALMGAVAEAITNANKHAGASRVTVFLDSDGEMIECSVNDDGIGFDPRTVTGGFGIEGSMRSPVESLGGTLVVRSRAGVGTEVAIRLPLDTEDRR